MVTTVIKNNKSNKMIIKKVDAQDNNNKTQQIKPEILLLITGRVQFLWLSTTKTMNHQSMYVW